MDLVLAATLLTPNIIQLLLVIVILGFCLWLVVTYIPMLPPMKNLLVGVVVLVIVLWILRSFNLI